MKYEKLATDIIENVGGKENVSSVVHCVTRLRFKLKDESRANTEVLKNMDGVVTVMKSGGQYQVIIGNHVSDVYKDVLAIGGFQNQAPVDEKEEGKKGSLFNNFVDIISSIFTPILGVLVATGMIKGLNALFISLGWLEETSGTYQLLNATGDALLYFLPIFLGYTAMKKFGGSPFVGMAIGAALLYPSTATVTTGDPLYTLFEGTMFQSPIFLTFLGIPVISMSYASSVIPVIISAFFAAKVEKKLSEVIPGVIKTFFIPFLTLLIVVPLTFMTIGPIASWAGVLIGEGSLAIYNFSPIMAGIFIGSVWQVLVIFGLHWGLIPIAISNLSTMGFDTLLAAIVVTAFAQSAAVLAIMTKTKQQKLKTLSIPAFVSGMLGVTEPAIYGITLPLKKPFIISCIGAAVGGGIIGWAGSKTYMFGGLGIFTFPSYISPEGITFGFWGSIIAVIVAFVLTYFLTYFFGGIDKEQSLQSTKKAVAASSTELNNKEVLSPLEGKVIELSKVKDVAFSSGALGKGVAIEPSEGKLYAPISGTVSALFPTKHAIGITADSGAEILIHIGMDTVQLKGEHFTTHIKKGDYVKNGQLLIEFDIDQILKTGKLLTTPVVITNHDKFNIELRNEKQVKIGEPLFRITPVEDPKLEKLIL